MTAPPRARGRRPTASTALGLLAISLWFLGCSPACAAEPIPGSPLDAYNHHVPYDNGSHMIARYAAIVSYTLMVAVVLFGAILRLRFLHRTVRRATLYGAHMVLALSALIFGAVHGFTFLYQPIWNIGVVELTVPFTADVQQIPVGLGVLGTELGIAVGCSVWLQRRLGYRTWLRFHQLGYAVFALIWLHVFTVHPEPRGSNLVAGAIAGGAGAILLAFLVRIFPSRSRLRQATYEYDMDAEPVR
ncbi:hypothetical protein SRB5_45090 [Streptomyces sp. RB5]|uniref:Ferric oxidoreductase domain-containing protein n=1 Tax=Streptomyces smaragdinus TaxID=2585196 RepID=A0A7K0CLI1_9ACTN|nr:ferric reductase-like transmembrane domain-containing protein [Streptomyces smaragdinus]MQY14345.1 hypothetical protein [Streptomyces smaragdinus]